MSTSIYTLHASREAAGKPWCMLSAAGRHRTAPVDGGALRDSKAHPLPVLLGAPVLQAQLRLPVVLLRQDNRS